MDFQGLMDFLGLKEARQGLSSWIRVDTYGDSQTNDFSKLTVMRRCHLAFRDLRLIDPQCVYPPTILGREKAIVVNLEQIRCIITADEVLLVNSLDSSVSQFVVELQRRLTTVEGGEEVRPVDLPSLRRSRGRRRFDNVFGRSSLDYLPFEFRALEVALESACTFLGVQVIELTMGAYLLLNELMSKISTQKLELVRHLKSKLVALTRRVQKFRDEIEQLMDDDEDMAGMYLTEKKRRMESSSNGDPSFMRYSSTGGGQSISAPVSPVSSPRHGKKRHESLESSDRTTTNIEELEMLLEQYLVVIDSTLNKLTSLKEYIDDTEDFINIQLDRVRNQLILSELLLTTARFVVSIFAAVTSVFGMNFQVPLFDHESGFKWVLVITGIFGVVIFCLFLWFFYRKLMPFYRRLMPLSMGED